MMKNLNLKSHLANDPRVARKNRWTSGELPVLLNSGEPSYNNELNEIQFHEFTQVDLGFTPAARLGGIR